MPVIINSTGAVALGLETTFGTAVTRDLFVRVTSISGHAKRIDRARRQHTYGTAATHGGMPIAHVDGNISVDALSFGIQAHYNSIEPWEILYAAMGAASAPSGAGPYVHTLTLDDTLPSYTIETIAGKDRAGTTSARVFAGCMCNELTMSLQARGTAAPMLIETTWIARDESGETTATSQTFSDDDTPVLHHHVGDITWNSATISKTEIENITIRINNALQTGRYGMGSQLASQPQTGGERTVTIEIQMERTTADVLYASYVSGADTDMTFSVETSSSRSLDFTFHNAIISELSPTFSLNGIEMQTVTFMARAVPGGGNGLQVVVTNALNTQIGG